MAEDLASANLTVAGAGGVHRRPERDGATRSKAGSAPGTETGPAPGTDAGPAPGTDAGPKAGWAAAWRWLTANPIGANPEGRRYGVGRWRRSSGIFLIYLAYSVSDLLSSAGPLKIAGGLLLMAIFIGLYLGPLPAAMFGGPKRYRIVTLAGMPTIMVLYLTVFGRGGLLLATYLSVATALLVIPLIGIPAIAALAAAVTWVPEHVGAWDIHGQQWALSGPPVLAAIALLTIRSNVVHRIELMAAQAEVERLAKEQERLRIARDLHDLLGHALTSITMKAELASRLVDRDPDRAAAEMRQVADLGRQSLSDVRATVAGYRDVSLVTELAAARQVLSAAGIQAELPASVEDVPTGLRELFGWALREGVTNAVRHSKARHVWVTLGKDSIEIVDDGIGPMGRGFRVDAHGRLEPVTPATGAPAPRGNGLTGLIERAAAAGGRVRVGSPATAPGPGDAQGGGPSGQDGSDSADGKCVPGGVGGSRGTDGGVDVRRGGAVAPIAPRPGFRLRVEVPG
jgi:two-component system sensor histidine kinase DesK